LPDNALLHRVLRHRVAFLQTPPKHPPSGPAQYDATNVQSADRAIDRLISNEIDFEIMQQTRSMAQPWYLIRVGMAFDVLDPVVDQQINDWIVRSCRSQNLYNLGLGLFEDQADATLFRIFWA